MVWQVVERAVCRLWALQPGRLQHRAQQARIPGGCSWFEFESEECGVLLACFHLQQCALQAQIC
jgi:hypothetical protein